MALGLWDEVSPLGKSPPVMFKCHTQGGVACCSLLSGIPGMGGTGSWSEVSCICEGGKEEKRKGGQAPSEQGCCREARACTQTSRPTSSGSRRVELGAWKRLTLRNMGKDISRVWPGLQDASGHCTPTLVTMASPPHWESRLFSGRSGQRACGLCSDPPLLQQPQRHWYRRSRPAPSSSRSKARRPSTSTGCLMMEVRSPQTYPCPLGL